MLLVKESSGYKKSIRASLSSSRNQSKKQKANHQCEDILLNINSMMNKLDYLQKAIENRNNETKYQLKKYAPLYFQQNKVENCYEQRKKDFYNENKENDSINQKIENYGHQKEKGQFQQFQERRRSFAL